ncbi:MAG: hypothetical protein ACREU0_06945 [Burkholderiales bacterium]
MPALAPIPTGQRLELPLIRKTTHRFLRRTHILNLATKEWFDENGFSWLDHSPRIKLVPEPDLRKPYPLSWEEQDRLFRALPAHLDRMCLFKVNTGCREAEVCGLRWDWELTINEFNTSVFILPAHTVKNGTVLNNVGKSVINSVRGQHSEYVFTYRGRRIQRINNTGWKQARISAGMPHVRVHDLKHCMHGLSGSIESDTALY